MELPELTRRSIAVDDISILLDAPSHADFVLEHSLSGQSENPYWGVLWDAAIPMAQYIAGRDWGDHKQCLELGCGLGLTGIAAWKSGLPVLMTDIVPEAVQLATRNARLNGLANCRPTVLDWNQPSKSQYSTIIACDVLYERSQHAGLLKFLKAASTTDTEIHIGDPGRQSSQEFTADARANGFSVEVLNAGGHESVSEASQFQIFVLRRVCEL